MLRISSPWGSRRQIDDFLNLGAILTLVVPVENDLALNNPSGMGNDTQNGLPGHALAAPALAYYTQGLSPGNVKVNAVDSMDGALFQEKVGFEVLYL